MSPSKRVKTDSANAEHGVRKKNFIKACLNVSFEAYKDYKKRFQLLYLQECFNNTCVHADKNANIIQATQTAEQLFKINFKNNTWIEALEICLISTSTGLYMSADVLKDIVEIIMNGHLDSENTKENLLTKCQDALMCQFHMYPPCLKACLMPKGIRDCYKKFLTSPMDRKDNTLSNRKIYLSDEGIVSHCLRRLAYDLSMESSDDTLIEKQEVPSEIEGVKRLHWKKENFELFELLLRTERIERCMLVLETVVHLLQTDLALWHCRLIWDDSRKRSQRPLLAYILWPHNCLTFGTVTRQCVKIMELFAYYIHLQYSERHIKTMSIWMNLVIEMFYMYDRYSDNDYPNTSSYCAVFAKQFHKIISPLPNTSISRILKKIQPCFMQHLLGMHHIQRILNITHNDILHTMIWCVKDMSWDNYPVGNEEPTICKKSTVKPHKLLDYLTKICKSSNVAIDIPKDTYAKLELRKEDSHIQQDYLIDLLFSTFVALLEAYNIKNFYNVLECYNRQENNEDQISCGQYTVSETFIRKYTSIVQTLKELLVILKEKANEEPSKKKLSDLINVYLS